MKIAVIGHSCSGKTKLTHELAKMYPDHRIFHTDKYRPADFEESMYAVMDDIARCKTQNIICEGIHTFRLLRKGAELRRLFFDVVIECKTDERTQMSRYMSERDASRWGYIPSFNKSLDKIYADYKRMVEAMDKKPVFVEYHT